MEKKITKQFVKDSLYKIQQDLESAMWEQFKVCGGSFDTKEAQIFALIELGRMAESVRNISNARNL